MSTTNANGIPKAPFVSTVEDYVSSVEQVDAILRQFQETINKYKFMEVNILKRTSGLRGKVPEIEGTLDMVAYLESEGSQGHDMETTFELNDTLYARAKIPPTTHVCLWLGANVMLEYPTAEATELLQSKLEGATESLAQCEEDLEFLREQITTMEVNTARVYNWSVAQRRRKGEEGG